jgi:hypothetical protein
MGEGLAPGAVTFDKHRRNGFEVKGSDSELGGHFT